MTAVVAPSPPAGTRTAARRPAWQVAWPLWLCTAGIPLAFLVGAQGLVWALPGAVLGTRLLLARRVRVPRAALLLGAFCALALLGVLQVRGIGAVVFGYRWLLFAGALCAEVWLFTVSVTTVPTERVVRWIASLWLWVVAFGWLAMWFRVDQLSPLQSVLPAGVRAAGFVDQLSAWRFAEVQGIAGQRLARPSAPFAWANGWGSAFALCAPCFVRAWLVGVGPRRRALGIVLGLAGLPPMIASLNRGLWLTLGAVLAYGAVRQAARRDLRPLATLAVTAAVVALLLGATPLGGSVTARLSDVANSNDSRAEVYRAAWSGALASPLVGHGAPHEVPGSPLPPVGTHGLLWNLLYSFGFLAAGLFLLWLVLEVLASAPSRAPGALWLHLTLLVGLLQVPIYGLLPQVVLLGTVAGLARREARRATDARPIPAPGSDR